MSRQPTRTRMVRWFLGQISNIRHVLICLWLHLTTLTCIEKSTDSSALFSWLGLPQVLRQRIINPNLALATWLYCTICIVQATYAIEIDFRISDSSERPLTAEELAAFRTAADQWEAKLLDPIEILIDIKVRSMSGALGTGSAAGTLHDWTNIRQALLLDAFREEERQAMLSLPLEAIPLQYDDPLDGRVTDTATQVKVPIPMAKALNLGTGRDPTAGDIRADGAVTLNSDSSLFDFNPGDGIDSDKYDVVAVIIQEIGHALGFESTVDTNDFLVGLSGHITPPQMLDIWRFPETDSFHHVTNEPRIVTSGPAEFYDGVLNNFAFSHGVRSTDVAGCPTSGASCQASHWSFGTNNAMTALIFPGVFRDLGIEDVHALDYLGYDTSGPSDSITRIPPDAFGEIPILIGWAALPNFPNCLIDGPGCFDFSKDFDSDFSDFSPPPETWTQPAPDFQANLAFRAGLSFDADGLRFRSAVGFARFQDAQDNVDFPVVEDPTHGDDDDIEPVTSLPPTLLDFVFQSDDTAGVPFVFRDTFSEAGSELDMSLGEFGGYWITGFIDGAGDGQIGDVDATLVFTLLADQSGIPQTDVPNLFQLAMDSSSSLIVYDQEALGIPEPSADFDNDGDVDGFDFLKWQRGELPNPLSVEDLALWENQYGTIPALEASMTVPEPATGLILLIGIATLLTGGRTVVSKPIR
jgi:hypothetical protein